MDNPETQLQQRFLRYQAIISLTLEEVSQRLELLSEDIPDNIDATKLTEAQFKALSYIDAIEEEWSTDTLKREQLSCIQWHDEP